MTSKRERESRGRRFVGRALTGVIMSISPFAGAQTAPNFATARVYPVGPQQDPPVTYCPYGLAVADVDNDGDLDVAVTAIPNCFKGGHVRVFRNTPECWSGSPCTEPFQQIDDYTPENYSCEVDLGGSEDEDQCGPRKLTFGNLQLGNDSPDGFADFAVTIPQANTVCIFKNNGDVAPPSRGRFSQHSLVGLNPGGPPMDIVSGNWNTGGGDDLAIASRWLHDVPPPGVDVFRPRLAVLESDGSGGFDEIDVDLTEEQGRGWELDVEGEDPGNFLVPAARLVMSNPDFARVHRFITNSGTFGHEGSDTSVLSKGLSIDSFTSGPRDVATTRWPSSTEIQVRWLLGQTSGALTLQGQQDDETDLGPHGIDSGPVNRNDTSPDIVVVSETSDDVFVFVNSGSTNDLFVDPPYTFDLGVGTNNDDSRQVILADLNEDGYLDIITSNWADGTISMLINVP